MKSTTKNSSPRPQNTKNSYPLPRQSTEACRLTILMNMRLTIWRTEWRSWREWTTSWPSRLRRSDRRAMRGSSCYRLNSLTYRTKLLRFRKSPTLLRWRKRGWRALFLPTNRKFRTISWKPSKHYLRSVSANQPKKSYRGIKPGLRARLPTWLTKISSCKARSVRCEGPRWTASKRSLICRTISSKKKWSRGIR